MTLPRRNIDELRARFELEPHLDDVFLEGEFDKEVVDLAMKSEPKQLRPTYLIQDIEIDQHTLAKRGLTSGNRQRLIAFSAELDLPEDTPVRFLIDSDFDHWLKDVADYPGLVRTKYCDTETVFLDDDFIEKIVLDAGRARINNLDEFVTGAYLCLRQLYCLRFEICVAEIDRGLIDFTRCLSWTDDCPTLDLGELIQRSLSLVLSNNARADLLNRVNERTGELSKNPVRSTARGHDFLDLLAWSIKNKRGVDALSNSTYLPRFLVLLVSDYASELLEPLELALPQTA